MRILAILLLGSSCHAAQDAHPGVIIPKGQIQGKVHFRGNWPVLEPIRVPPERVRGGDPDTVPDEILLVNEDGALRNAMVWVKSGAPAADPAPAPAPALMEINDCRFQPRVIPLRAGQPLMIRVVDKRNYCVDIPARLNNAVNLWLTKGGEHRIEFFKPEIGVPVKAVRPWMSAHIHVLPHSFFAVTDERGVFEIKGLPPGEYEVEAWHEKLGLRSARVTLDAKAGQTVDFEFDLARAK
jgi:hypothetical protein